MFNDLVGSALGASQEFRFRKVKHSAKNYSAKTVEKFFWKIYIKFDIFPKNLKI